MPSMVSREPSQRGAVSRAGIVHGVAGFDRQGHTDMWYDLDTFLLDQVTEVLDKLEDGSLDDEIWGKIVVMEKNKRVAKAYLRKTTVIVDGSEDDFDGKTLGFNAFDNQFRDEHTEEIREKIGDGVILKMDYQGNIKGMARGTTPVVCQGWKDNEKRHNSISDRLSRLQGRLNCSDEESKAYKMCDMRRFKAALERETSDSNPDAKTLLLKTTVRVALVKDGGDMTRTPCWFAVVNIVALDMLKSKIPNIRELAGVHESATYGQPRVVNAPIYATRDGMVSQEVLNTETLTQILAAAVKQANGGHSQSLHNLPVSVDQLAHLASTLSLAKTDITPSTQNTNNKKDRRRSYKVPSDDSSGEDSNTRSDSSGVNTHRTRNKRWDNTTKSMDVIQHGGSVQSLSPESTRRSGLTRPKLQDVRFDRSYSTTSDYDSNREFFDSGSWSSTASKGYQGSRSATSSLVSDNENNNNSKASKHDPVIKQSIKQQATIDPAPNKPTLNILTAPELLSGTLSSTSSLRSISSVDKLPVMSELPTRTYAIPNTEPCHTIGRDYQVPPRIVTIDDNTSVIYTQPYTETNRSTCTTPDSNDFSRRQSINQIRNDRMTPRPESPDFYGPADSADAAYRVEHSAYAVLCRRAAQSSPQADELPRAPATTVGTSPICAPSSETPVIPPPSPPTPRGRLSGAWTNMLRRRAKSKGLAKDACHQLRNRSQSNGRMPTESWSGHAAIRAQKYAAENGGTEGFTVDKESARREIPVEWTKAIRRKREPSLVWTSPTLAGRQHGPPGPHVTRLTVAP